MLKYAVLKILKQVQEDGAIKFKLNVLKPLIMEYAVLKILKQVQEDGAIKFKL